MPALEVITKTCSRKAMRVDTGAPRIDDLDTAERLWNEVQGKNRLLFLKEDNLPLFESVRELPVRTHSDFPMMSCC